MSILIRGMEMPSCCIFCPVSNSFGCGLANPPIIMTPEEMLAGRPDWCPLVSVPPHGRLGDLDALAAHCDDPYWCVWLSDIEAAPTIIPAEEADWPMTNEDYLKSKTGRSLAIALATISGHEGNPDQDDVDYFECWLKQEAK